MKYFFNTTQKNMKKKNRDNNIKIMVKQHSLGTSKLVFFSIFVILIKHTLGVVEGIDIRLFPFQGMKQIWEASHKIFCIASAKLPPSVALHLTLYL